MGSLHARRPTAPASATSGAYDTAIWFYDFPPLVGYRGVLGVPRGLPSPLARRIMSEDTAARKCTPKQPKAIRKCLGAKNPCDPVDGEAQDDRWDSISPDGRPSPQNLAHRHREQVRRDEIPRVLLGTFD